MSTVLIFYLVNFDSKYNIHSMLDTFLNSIETYLNIR